MATGPETQLKEKVLKALRARGAFAEKIHGGMYQRAGIPDILLCYRGRFVAIELKAPNAKLEPSPEQARCIKEIDDAGGKTLVANSILQCTALLDEIDYELQQSLGGS